MAPSRSPLTRQSIVDAMTGLLGPAAVDTRDEVTLGIDDRIRCVGEFRVAKVHHDVDKKGQLVRVHVLVPVDDLQIVPWDSGNPQDIGIIRAHRR